MDIRENLYIAQAIVKSACDKAALDMRNNTTDDELEREYFRGRFESLYLLQKEIGKQVSNIEFYE